MSKTEQYFGMNFHVMAKPAGPICNLDCSYCYYLEKENLFPKQQNFQMNDDVLETFIRQYIQSNQSNEIVFSWQGGEPTLSGLDFYKMVVELQLKYADGKKIGNTLQTNGTIINEEWAEFFSKYQFLIGVSIDGTERLHDKYRKDKGGNPTFDKVVKSIEILKQYQVEFNTLTVVNNFNSHFPVEVYNFLKSLGSKYMQFLPIIERVSQNKRSDLKLIDPDNKDRSKIAQWSVKPLDYGNFMVSVFKEWLKEDVGEIYVRLFDVTLANYAGQDSGLCVYEETCGGAAVIEHNGNVYSCDHFVYDKHLIGNIQDDSLAQMMNSKKQIAFGLNKKNLLPKKCVKCEFLRLCYGGCPKHRIIDIKEGSKRLNYFCKGYLKFFSFTQPYMKYMLNEIRNDRTPSNVMHWKQD